MNNMENKENTIKDNYEEKCPQCGLIGKFIPPPKVEDRKLIVDFVCPNGHTFTKVFQLK
jgi:predicted RNA-binding Zn-ribbon protein involved in translation (DUF1610 family)